jgi:hypothetical protein
MAYSNSSGKAGVGELDLVGIPDACRRDPSGPLNGIQEAAEIAPPAKALPSNLRRGADVESSCPEGQDQQEELGEERSDLTLEPAYAVEGRRSP